jgi:hypothetical protein
VSIMYEHGWLLFVLSEGLTWLAVVLFLVGRYWLELNRLSQWCLLFIILCNNFQALLAGIDYYFTGKVSFFQVVIILFIIYASTLGSSDFQRLDKYIQQKLNKYRGTLKTEGEQDEIQAETQDDIRTYIKYRRQLFSIHTTAFVVLHFVWLVIDMSTTTVLSGYEVFFPNEWFHHPHQGYFHNPILNIISYVWSIVYVFDVYIFLIYSFLGRFKKR